MGNKIMNIFSGIGILIGMFLVLNHGEETVSILSTIANNSVYGIKTLQGR